ncbi:zinc-binding dehydrogenase [Sorangium sp. So ce1014]|uniref:quinone oxidoreductase family protein n=1 Tax=Sorangium sp. So ce1014 TaxID=3133326 RepID=UPI003F5EE32E
MKAIVVQSLGGPQNLALVDLPAPSAGAGQVLIAVEAAGVGLVDVLLRQGAIPGSSAPGFVPGIEVAGTVITVGEGVDRSWLERRVFTMVTGGGYAERVAAEASHLVPLPPTMKAVDAVALGVNALVAEFILRRARVKAGERVLVRGASGGIGVMATQLAARCGAVVAAATSSVARGQRLLQLGASQVLDRAATSAGETPEGFDVILDPVAGPDTASFLGKLNQNGRMVVCGAAGGFPPPDFGMGVLRAFKKSLTFAFLSLDSIATTERAAALKEIFDSAASGELKPVIDESLALESASAAHAKLEAGGVFGKLVLVP